MSTKVESNIKDLLKDIGTLQDELKQPNDAFSEVLMQIGQQIVSQLKQSLRNEGIDQNSLLSQSIESNIVSEGGVVSIQISANDYWKFVNDGVNGVLKNVGGEYSFKTIHPNRKMAASIQDYMGRRGISDAANYKSVSYVIATKVKKYGIEPTHFLDKVMTDEFIEQITNALAEDFQKKVQLTIG